MIRGAINALRSDVDKRLDNLVGKVDALAKDHTDHKLHVAEHYMSKASANAVFEKLALQLSDLGAKVETRLMRIEDKVDARMSRDP
jgi:hypothetical protein